MSLMDTNEILEALDNILEKVNSGTNLNSEDRDNLADAYNYISETRRKPSLTNALRTKSAQVAKVENQLEIEREKLKNHKKFVEENFDKAEQYFRAIQFGGYAVFFTIWGFTQTWINPFWGSISALFMICSAIIFSTWEILKSLIFGKYLKDHASLISGKVEEFISSRRTKILKGYNPEVYLSKSRLTFNILSILTALIAIIIFLWQLFQFILNQMA